MTTATVVAASSKIEAGVSFFLFFSFSRSRDNYSSSSSTIEAVVFFLLSPFVIWMFVRDYRSFGRAFAFFGGLIGLLRSNDSRFEEAHRVPQALLHHTTNTYNRYIHCQNITKNNGDIYVCMI